MVILILIELIIETLWCPVFIFKLVSIATELWEGVDGSIDRGFAQVNDVPLFFMFTLCYYYSLLLHSLYFSL